MSRRLGRPRSRIFSEINTCFGKKCTSGEAFSRGRDAKKQLSRQKAKEGAGGSREAREGK
jgi:hypothetical protein